MSTVPNLSLLAGSLASLLLLASCESKPAATQDTAAQPNAADSTQTNAVAAPTATSFGKTTDGTEVQLFTLKNQQGLTATITNYSGICGGVFHAHLSEAENLHHAAVSGAALQQHAELDNEHFLAVFVHPG